jgi:hypothetical protein
VKRLRTLRLRYWIVPAVLAALAARALMPVGFMSVSGGDGISATIAMCSRDETRREQVEIPGGQRPAEHRPHCEYCLAPLLGTPFAQIDYRAPAVTPALPVPVDEQLASSPLRRSQEARAPPHA